MTKGQYQLRLTDCLLNTVRKMELKRMKIH